MKKIVKCKTLLGESNIDFSIECLSSFVKNSKKEILIEIFDDGSLTDESKNKLKNSLKDCKIITREDRDEIINYKLSNYPSCLHYRNKIIYAHKLFDVMLYDDDDHLLFIDSDVFFIKKFELPDFNTIPIFIKDKHNAYSFNPLEFIKINFDIFSRINTGFFYFPRDLYSLDYLEELLTDKIISKGIDRISWLEQTLWAFVANRSKIVGYFDNSQIVMAKDEIEMDTNLIAVHLVTSFRSHYDRIKSYSLIVRKGGGTNTKIKVLYKNASLKKYQFITDRVRKSLLRRVGITL